MSDDMNITPEKDTDYRLLKTINSRQTFFINMADENSVKTAGSQHNNVNLYISVCSYIAPYPSAPRTYPLYFKITSSSVENAQKAALEICFYINNSYFVPEDCIEIIYNGGGKGTDAGAAAEMIVLISPMVFSGQPTILTPAINYNLARQILEDGIENIDIDVYRRDYLIKLPNSFNTETNSYIISISTKELTNIDFPAIAELSKQPRPEDSMIIPRKAPEAVEWFAEILKETENEHKYQKKLLNLLLKTGWQIPPCISRLLWADLSKEQALEACRVISQFYSWINASPNEIWHHFQRIDQRNYIADPQRLRAILNFATENPGFVGCERPLLNHFCRKGNCFIKELIDECERPYLFEQP